MVNGNVIVHTSQLSRMGAQQKVLKDGSQVLVRIISDRGGGKYEGSVAGARVIINSNTQLKTGSTFTATVTLKNGHILLSPQIQNEQNAVMQNFELSVLNDQSLMAFIKSLNLPADDLTFHLLQQMKQLEMKLDSSLLGKLHNLALKFNGKEKRAAQILMILAKKGIDFSEEELLQLLGELDWEQKPDGGEGDNSHDYELLNRINSKNQSWQLLPYQIMQGQDSLANGTLGILFDDNSSIKLVNVECNWLSSNHRYLFSLQYEGGKCKTIGMNAADSSELTQRLSNLLQKRLMAAGKNITVKPQPAELLEGTACASQDFYAFEGQV